MRKWKDFQYKELSIIFGIFLVLGSIIFIERMGISYTTTMFEAAYLDDSKVVRADKVMESLEKKTLVLFDSTNPSSVLAEEQFRQILKDMKLGYTLVDTTKAAAPDFKGFERVVLLIPDISVLKDKVLDLADWVHEGGDVLFGLTLQKENYLSLIEQKLGILTSGYTYANVGKIYIEKDFMIGGGQSYTIEEPFESAWGVELSPEHTKVYAYTDDERKVPLIWEARYGKGKFIVNNFGIYDKVVRGLYAASLSLMTDTTVYPVINGSVFYIDDFPSPVPSGSGEYIARDFGVNIDDFYTNLWWPDMMKLTEKYGIKYTGVVIENYEDETTGEIEEQRDTDRFVYFGNLLLSQGGELGYHGYNHQPLSLTNVDYKGFYSYNRWSNEEAMRKSIAELDRFIHSLFPEVGISVYVPPSNVLSKEGRYMLQRNFINVKTIAGIYFTGNFAYVQEFEVAEDGIVEQPRIVSGSVMDDFMKLAAFSELNMHFAYSHFVHPDDPLDVERGAELGWKNLYASLQDQLDWVYQKAPMIRNMTGSELSGAIQRYASLAVKKTRTDKALELELSNFHDEAYLMVRMNEGIPGAVSGGELQQLAGNLYLLKATTAKVTIEIEE